jgi:hypothetical protein
VRWFVSVYVLGVVGGSLVALIGLSEGVGTEPNGAAGATAAAEGVEKDDLPF